MSQPPSLVQIIAENGGDVVAGLRVPYGHTISLNERGELVGFEAYNDYHRIDNAAIRQLATLGTLEVLDLSCAGTITDRGLACLVNLPRLRKLALPSERITDEGMIHVGKLQTLVGLSLNGVHLTQRGLAELARLERLRTLALYRTNVGDSGLKPIGTMRGLQVLLLPGNDLSDRGLPHLAALVGLEEVNLSYNPRIMARGTEVLKAWPLVKRLELASTQLGDNGLKLMRHCPLLESLTISNAAITDAGLAHLQSCIKLRELSLSENQITDAGLIWIRQLTELESLTLDETSVSDDGLVTLSRLPRLKKLSVCDTKVTGRTLETLNLLNQLEEFDHSGLPAIRLETNYVRHQGLHYDVDLAASELIAYLHYGSERPVWKLDVQCTPRLSPQFSSPPTLSGPGFPMDAATWRDLAPGEIEVSFDETEHHPILPDNPCNFYDGEHSFPNGHRIRLLRRHGRRFTVHWTFEVRRYLEDDPRSIEVLADVKFNRVVVWADHPIDAEIARTALKRYFDPGNFAAPESLADGRHFKFEFWPNVS